MNKAVLSIVCLMFSLICFADCENSGVVCKSVNNKSNMQGKCEKQIDNLTKRAEYYKKKASQEKSQSLAEIYTECGKAKQKMAEGYKLIFAGSKKIQAIYDSSPVVKTAVEQNNFNDCILSKKKGKRYSSHIKDMQKCADLCLNNAKQAEADGKKELAKQYNDLASAIKIKCQGLSMVQEGKNEFSEARKALKNCEKQPSP